MANAFNYSINNKEISFSTKALTIDGNEYLYKNITAIKHSSAKCLYLFKVDGKWHELYYDEAHKKGVSTIFKKIADHLTAIKKAKTAEEAPSLIEALKQTQGIAEEPAEEAPVEEPAEEAPVEEPAEEPDEEEPAEESTEGEAPVENEVSTEEAVSEDTAEEETPSEDDARTGEPDKKAKKRKAFIVFAIIIALFIIAGVVYFFAIGLPSESSPADGQNTTHQYNDIDELIDEMQE